MKSSKERKEYAVKADDENSETEPCFGRNLKKKGTKRANCKVSCSCLSGERLAKLLDMYYSAPVSLRDLASMFGVSTMTVWRVVQQTEPACFVGGD